MKKKLILLLNCAVLASPLAAQEDPGFSSRDKMWPAPTAQDWERPVLVTFQRSWEDALASSKETGKPILICVNMDGEIASEHYAGIRYRQPEIAKLYEPYVAVIASVYRHAPRDYDDQGRRILCPRFGSVTCGEHIEIEPILFEKFFDGKRIAPRHLMIEIDGKENYDVYYALDTDSVFQTIQDGIANRSMPWTKVPRGDRSTLERVASRDVEDRDAVETAYQSGNKDLRRSLLEEAGKHPEAAPMGLLRLAAYDMDLEMNRLAQRALAQSNSEDAVGLIADALRSPMEMEEREALIAALERIGKSSEKARTLGKVQRGLSARSATVDVEGWDKAFPGGASYAPAPELATIESKLAGKDSAAQSAPTAQSQLELAEATLDYALNYKTQQRFSLLLFQDALNAARNAEKLGASGWRIDTAIALASYYSGSIEEGYTRAESAVKSMPPGEESWNAMAALAIFAEARWQKIRKAILEKQEWPKEWFADVNAAYSAIARHPYGTDGQIAIYYDILDYFRADRRALQVLKEGLGRFADSWTLHEKLRQRVLKEKGAEGLESVYQSLLGEDQAPPVLEWYAGYASFLAAESFRRERRNEKAMQSYENAMLHYERYNKIDPEGSHSADQDIALALAGRARLFYEQGQNERALEELLASLARSSKAASKMDGLNITPLDTAKLLLARLQESKQEQLAEKLAAALEELDVP